MNYTSTRDSALCTGASTAILTGIAPGGGLFVPQQFPQVDMREFYGLTYPQTAQKVLGMFLTDYDPDFLKTATEQTYSTENFGGKAGFAAHVAGNTYALELWHGPTCAFKDYALQLMPRLLVEAKKNLGETGVTKILVATSGDTGKAALAGYAGLPGVSRCFIPTRAPVRCSACRWPRRREITWRCMLSTETSTTRRQV